MTTEENKRNSVEVIEKNARTFLCFFCKLGFWLINKIKRKALGFCLYSFVLWFRADRVTCCFSCSEISRGALLRDVLSIYSIKNNHVLFPKHINNRKTIFFWNTQFNLMPKNGFSYNYRKPLNKLIFERMLSLVYSYEFPVINSSVNQHLRKHLHSVDGTDTSGCTEWIQSCKRWHRHPLRRSFWKTSHPFLQRYDGRERYKMLHETEIGARCKEGRCFPVHIHQLLLYQGITGFSLQKCFMQS